MFLLVAAACVRATCDSSSVSGALYSILTLTLSPSRKGNCWPLHRVVHA